MNRGRLQGRVWHGSRWFLLALAVVALALPAAGCGGDDDDNGQAGQATATGGAGQPSGEPIVIGAAMGLTGIISAFDLPALSGVEIAVEELNAADGILGRPVRVVKSDTKSDINQGSRAGLEVLDKGADAMIVTLDFNFGGGAAREAQKAGIVVLSPGAGSPKFGVQGIGTMAYTLGIAATTDAAVAAEWGIEDKKFKTAYLLLDDITDYDKDQCKGFKTRWKQLGGTILGEDTFKNSDPSVATQVTRIKSLSSEPDLIMLCSFPPGGAVAVKQLRDAGVQSAIISNGAMDGDFWYKDSIPKLSNFFYTATASVWGDDPSEDVNAFVKKYKARKGQPQAYFTVLGYIAVYALKTAMERADSTEGEAVAAELNKFDREPVAGVELSFSENIHIDAKREERIMEVNNGKHRLAAVRAAEKQLPLFGE